MRACLRRLRLQRQLVARHARVRNRRRAHNNVEGIAGSHWKPWILPVRVLGKCGGYDSDILRGNALGRGAARQRVPDNPYPASVINMSLGATSDLPGRLSQPDQRARHRACWWWSPQATRAAPVDSPANCPGAARRGRPASRGYQGGLQQYRPGGRRQRAGRQLRRYGAGEPCLFSIDTTDQPGDTTPARRATRISSTPISEPASRRRSSRGIAALAELGERQSDARSDYRARLQRSATPFPQLDDVADCTVPAATSPDSGSNATAHRRPAVRAWPTREQRSIYAQRPFGLSPASSATRPKATPCRWTDRRVRNRQSHDRDLRVDRVVSGPLRPRAEPTRRPPRGADIRHGPRSATVKDDAGLTVTRTCEESDVDFGDPAVVTSPSAPPPRSTAAVHQRQRRWRRGVAGSGVAPGCRPCADRSGPAAGRECQCFRFAPRAGSRRRAGPARRAWRA